ncbi:MAG: FAD-dependent oxidoreductase [Coriobacteriia bacterium]|nr:FAD-dependent oxidoreductase [Coriobacteriia bacterium]
MKNEGLTRRGFIEGVTVAALGVTAASVLSGCGSSTTQTAAPAEKSMFVDTLNPQDTKYDTYTTDYAAIFSPIKVGSLTLKNRIIKTGAGSDTHSSKPPLSQNSLDYMTNFAKGGAAVVMMDGGVMAPYGFNGLTSTTFKTFDEATAGAKVMSDAVHAAGAYVGFQMTTGSLGPAAAILQVDTLSVAQIKQLTANFAQQALAAKKAGFDIVEFKGATSDDMNAFITRRQNKRKDEYGPQSIENRARWLCEIVQAMKAACGKDFVVSTLINVYEENDAKLGDNDKYLTVEESVEVAKLLEKAGVDWIQVRVGTPGLEPACWAPDQMHAGFHADGMTGYGTQFDYSSHFEGLQDGKHHGVGAFIPGAALIKKAVKIPVGCAGYMDPRTAPDLMNNAVKNGDIDLIFMNRPLTVDPELPNKLKAKKRDEVAPCTRCFHCHTAGISPKEPELCRVNAATQRAYTAALPEGYVLAPAKTVKNVMVIGGGPGGMEAARRAAQKGHKVTLYEKGTSLGGLVKTASGFKGSHERLEDLIAFLTKQQTLNKVTVVTGKEVDAAFVDTVKPDAIIVAVGGKRDAKFASSTVASPKVVNIGSYDNSKVGSNVVILGAGAQAVDLTFYLLAQGKKVQMVHADVAAKLDKEQSAHFRQYIPPHLQAKGVKIWSESTPQKIVDGGIVIKTGAGIETTLKCDTVVECWDILANTTLADALKSKYTVSLVGDCASAGKDKNILYAIQAGYDAARAI